MAAAAATTSTPSKLTLKLLVDTKARRVLFAEAEKDFVDFLSALLSFPLGSVVRLLSTDKMVGSLGDFYQSIEDLSNKYIQPTLSKDTVLKPKATFGPLQNTLLLPDDNKGDCGTTAAPAKKLYNCANSHRHVTYDPQQTCPQCNHTMSREVNLVGTAAAPSTGQTNSGGEGGFVKGVVTYMVMDNLEVKPMSTISSITLLNKFNITELGSLEEEVVELGMEQGLNLLKASLETKTVLTRVFLGA